MIFVDHREHKDLIKEFAKLDLEYEVKTLGVGDIHIKNGDDIICVERKSQNDFLNSFFDKRIFGQLYTMNEQFSLSVLIIEGEENIYTMRKVHPNAIRGMFTSIALDFQIPLIYSRNHRDTAKIVQNIISRLAKTRKPLSLHGSRKALTLGEQQLYVVESLPSIGPSLARSLLKKFKTIKSLVMVQEKTLQKVEKIGPKKAKLIKEVLEKEYEE